MGGKTDFALMAIANRFGAQQPDQDRVGINHLRSLGQLPMSAYAPIREPKPQGERVFDPVRALQDVIMGGKTRPQSAGGNYGQPSYFPGPTGGEVQTVYFPLAEAISGTIGYGVKEATGSEGLGFAAEMIAPSPTQIVKGLTKLGKPMMSEMTAWHGGPHKLDPEQLVRLASGEKVYVGGKYNALKEAPAGSTLLEDFPAGRFREAAVGTGEGAQAYGRGAAYLAEARKVADEYAGKLSQKVIEIPGFTPNTPVEHDLIASLTGRANTSQYGSGASAALDDLRSVARTGQGERKEAAQKMLSAMGDFGRPVLTDTGYLYKTDIPDEAVARMLDWDKPLSEQAEVLKNFKHSNASRKWFADENPTGEQLYRDLDRGQSTAYETLRSMGIPGIKYLDAGSRAAGEGSRNFVPFDENLIRILERNGIPTGAQPWKPGEWQGLGSRVEQTAAPYSLGDVTHGLPSNIPAAAPRVIDDNALRSLRSQATGLENASKGISLYITHDGKAIVSKPKGVKTPDRLKQFAVEHGLEYSEGTWRGPVSKGQPLYETAMPVKYREAGAKYHWE